MKVTIDFESNEKESAIPYEAKLNIIRRIVKAAHNPVEFVTVKIEPFITSDKP